MSWDATLYTPEAHAAMTAVSDEAPSFDGELGWWNYTHNTNRMIAEALTDLGCVNAFALHDDGPILKLVGPHWWGRLDGAPGPVGAEFLTALVKQLESDPAKYRTFNPKNGWGDFDSLVRVLSEMRDAALTERPAIWHVSG